MIIQGGVGVKKGENIFVAIAVALVNLIYF